MRPFLFVLKSLLETQNTPNWKTTKTIDGETTPENRVHCLAVAWRAKQLKLTKIDVEACIGSVNLRETDNLSVSPLQN